jgi:integrase/recombinase XerD
MQSYPFCSTRKRTTQIDYPILSEYRIHLEVDRGIVACHVPLAAATCFLDFLGIRRKAFDTIDRKDIDDFVTEQGSYYQKKTVVALAGLLRSLFRFLLARGLVDVDWAAFISSPRTFQGKRDPRYLKPDEVQRVLVGVDRTRLVGKRNYAILTLLGLYGLRAAEVAQLALDDVEWRSMTLRIRHRKCADAFELPLVPAVAAALAEYLEVRGDSAHREIFLSSLRPDRPFHPKSISIMARLAILGAGIEVAHPGSHSFRYAMAQKLFENERPISEIAAVLGHRNLRSTLGYISFAVHPLRELALNDGEALA